MLSDALHPSCLLMQGFEHEAGTCFSLATYTPSRCLHRLGVYVLEGFVSGNKLQGCVERSLFDGCALSEPRRIHAVLETSGASLVVNVFGDRV